MLWPNVDAQPSTADPRPLLGDKARLERISAPASPLPSDRFEHPSTVNPWDRAFSAAADKPIRLVAHQAAVSGKLADIVAAKRMAWRCLQLSPLWHALRLEPDRLAKPDANRARAIQAFEQSCEGYETVRSQAFSVRDDSVLPTLAALLIELMNRPDALEKVSPQARRDLLDFVRGTGSIELLRSLRPMLLTDATLLEAYGLPTDHRFIQASDATMLHYAIEIQACQRAGRCEQEALLDVACLYPQSVYGACVQSLADYPAQRMFGPLEQRADWARPRGTGVVDGALLTLASKDPKLERILKGWTSALSDEDLRQRWLQINALVAKLSGSAEKP